jgi:hypothetical protein
MSITFATTGGTSHSSAVNGLVNGGSYSFYVRCQDAAGNADPDDYVIGFSVAMPDTVPPTVTVTAPMDGSTVSGVITLTATAADDVAVASVQFRVDGVAVGAPVTVGPTYTRTWDTRGVLNGARVVTALALDTAGNPTMSAGVTVTVSNVPEPPVDAYAFDEGFGSTTADATGNGGTGTLLNGAAWSTGHTANAVNFDGVSARVSAGVRSRLANLAAVTAEAWIYPRSNGRWGWGTMLVKARSISPPEIYGWILGFDGTGVGRLRFTVEYSGTDLHVATAANALLMNQWQHVAVTWDGTPGAAGVHIYVNGVEVGYAVQQNPTGTRINDAAYPLTIGNSQFLDATWNGVIDDVRIYNRALTPAEILSDMTRPVGPGG